MATPAQILANRENAALSTGPKTQAGKAAVAQNSTTHGLSGAFRLLNTENPAEFQALLDALTAEHAPETHAESFLVREMAHAEWRLRRVAILEAEIFARASNAEPVLPEELIKLNRYQQATRKAWYNALNQLRNMRRADESAHLRRHEQARAQELREFEAYLSAPPPPISPALHYENCKTNPMPVHLQRELESLRRRNPDFDPELDRSQMTKDLRKWYDRNAANAA